MNPRIPIGRTGVLTRRNVLVGGAAIVGGTWLATGLTGCASVGGAPGAQHLSFWHLLTGGDGIKMAALVDQANEQDPSAVVTQTVLTWGTPYYTKLAMASAGGRAPDVAVMHASRLPGYAPGGLLDPWDLDLLAHYGVTKDKFPAPIWEACFSGDKLYCVALDAHPFILMYNTDIARKAGVLGADGQLIDITSPEQFVEIAGKMQKVTGKHGLSYGYLGDGAQMWRLFYTFYKQLGADMDLTGKTAVVDEDAAVTALEFMQTLLDGTIATASGDYATALAEFVNGGSGMFFTGVWELPTMIAAKLPVDARPIPALFGTPAVYADSHSFVLPHQDNPDPQKREEVYLFVSTVLKNSISWAQAGHIPAFLPVVDSPEYSKLLPQAHYASAAENLNYDPKAWFTGSGSDFQTFFAENIQSVLLNKSDARAGFAGFVRRLNVLLGKPSPVGRG